MPRIIAYSATTPPLPHHHWGLTRMPLFTYDFEELNITTTYYFEEFTLTIDENFDIIRAKTKDFKTLCT